ncbi:unnamed protein product [Zymoseptoria tritici ST99CH_1A5]|uniref:Uncharacterized protein n=1 Tax=Zymoseptoria tritici ST99CH_1A5 TaxID=1276529 RepID=A0A1Y6LF49_ZYMTR|nr:unnamed protein product [Zymoseptoria tritici ST99CH_1A5]
MPFLSLLNFTTISTSSSPHTNPTGPHNTVATPKNPSPDSRHSSEADAHLILTRGTSSPSMMAEPTTFSLSAAPSRATDNPLCPLLKLSAELRNKIWSLSYTVEVKAASTDLATACGPSYALLSTCRQINAEASGFFKEARICYWTHNHFTLVERHNVMEPEKMFARLSAMTEDKGTDMIERLHITVARAHVATYCEAVPGTACLEWRISKWRFPASGNHLRGEAFYIFGKKSLKFHQQEEGRKTLSLELGSLLEDMLAPSMSLRDKFALVWNSAKGMHLD